MVFHVAIVNIQKVQREYSQVCEGVRKCEEPAEERILAVLGHDDVDISQNPGTAFPLSTRGGHIPSRYLPSQRHGFVVVMPATCSLILTGSSTCPPHTTQCSTSSLRATTSCSGRLASPSCTFINTYPTSLTGQWLPDVDIKILSVMCCRYFKGDDDTYLIVENLQRYLATLDPKKPYFIGYRLSRRTVSVLFVGHYLTAHLDDLNDK